MIRRATLLVAAYVALTLVVSWPYFSYTNAATASYGGDQRLIIWTLAWDNHATLSGLPLFQSNLFFPAADSLRYNEHLFGVSLFTLPLAALGASPVLAHNIVWWLSWPMNGIAAFLLLRRYVADPCAAFVGSLGFVCSFYVMSHAHGHLHLIWMWPLPLSILLLERWFDEPRWSRLAAWTAVFLIGALTSWYVAVMMLIVNGLAGLAYASTYAGRDVVGRAFRPAVHLAVGAVVIAATLYPFARHYVGMRGGPGEAAANSATLASYVVPPENTLVGQWWKANVNDLPGSIWGETTLFAGWIALALAAIGLVSLFGGTKVPPYDRTGPDDRTRPDDRARRDDVVGRDFSPADRRAWIFPALAAVGFLISLGPSPALLGGSTFAPFSWLSGLPGFEGMRAPARFGIVMMLGVSGLAAFGVSALIRRFAPARPAVALVLVPFMLAEWFVVGFPAGKPRPRAVPAIYQTAEVQSARSLVSLPEYFGTSDWVLGGDYLYYSMAHWRPIVNGFGRTEPPGYAALVDQVRDFPREAQTLRALGLQYVIVHAERYPNHGREILDAAMESSGVRLVRRIDDDYLFELAPRRD